MTYRRYTAVTGTVQYNSVITVQGNAYGSSEHIQSLLLLTGDFRALAWFSRDANGFLVSNTPPRLLPELSIQNLRTAQPLLPFAPAAPD